MSRVLVTGGAGAIGSNLVASLRRDGHVVVVVDDLSSGRADNLPADVRLVEGSITDRATMDEAFAYSPQQVFHLAARFANQNSVDHPRDDLVVNGLGTLTVLERSVAVGVERVLVCSSSCVYGSSASGDEEAERFATDTPYAMTKMLGEGYARFFAEQRGLHTVIVRPFNVYGPGERPGPYRNVIPNFIAAAMRGEPLTITGTGDETRDFTYVDDAVGAMRAALDRSERPADTYNIATGGETSILELAERINDLTGNRGGVVHTPRRAWDGTPRRVGNIARARRELGYSPAIDLDEGLRRTHQWLREIGA